MQRGDPGTTGSGTSGRQRRAARGPAASATTQFLLHMHESHLDGARRYPVSSWYDHYVEGKGSSTASGVTRWDLIGVTPRIVTPEATFRRDFKASLDTPGALVVYFGHTMLRRRKGTFGIYPRPVSPPKNFKSESHARRWLASKNGIPNGELKRWLKKAKAKIVVFACCASSKMITRPLGKKKSTAIVVTDSGKDRVTDFVQWEDGVRAILDVLTGYVIDDKAKLTTRRGGAGDLTVALLAGNKAMVGVDRFLWVSGNSNAKIV